MSDIINILILLVVGGLSGVCASLGMGGGFILLIYLTAIMNMPQREAQLINLLFFLPIAAMSLFFHLKNKLVYIPAILPSVLSGVIGVFVGLFISSYLSNDGIRKAFAIFILIVGIKLLKDTIRQNKDGLQQKGNIRSHK